jgi:hypothetical protein
MTDEKPRRSFDTPSERPPNPLDFPLKDPLRETYEGSWQKLPLIQKVGVTVVLGFWLLFIAAMVLGDGSGQYLSRLAPFILVAAVLGVCVLLFGRRSR